MEDKTHKGLPLAVALAIAVAIGLVCGGLLAIPTALASTKQSFVAWGNMKYDVMNSIYWSSLRPFLFDRVLAGGVAGAALASTICLTRTHRPVAAAFLVSSWSVLGFLAATLFAIWPVSVILSWMSIGQGGMGMSGLVVPFLFMHLLAATVGSIAGARCGVIAVQKRNARRSVSADPKSRNESTRLTAAENYKRMRITAIATCSAIVVPVVMGYFLNPQSAGLLELPYGLIAGSAVFGVMKFIYWK